jgi:hypothetical protein
VIVTALLITAVALLAAILRRWSGRTPRLNPGEMARYRLASEKERQEWIYPFEM